MSRIFKEIRLTAANPSANITNPAGSIEIGGNFGITGTVSQNLTGGDTAIDTFTAAATFFSNASHLTFAITGGDGSEDVFVRWYFDGVDTDIVATRTLKQVTNA